MLPEAIFSGPVYYFLNLTWLSTFLWLCLHILSFTFCPSHSVLHIIYWQFLTVILYQNPHVAQPLTNQRNFTNNRTLLSSGGGDDAVLITIELPTFRSSVFQKYSRES